MAEFLTTTGVSYHLEKLINESEELLVIISPYIKMRTRVQDYIKNKCWESLKANVDHPINTVIIYRHEKQDAELEEWFHSLPYAVVGFHEDLHAKCYLNEKEALVTSMNLYDYSEVKNYEMGILVSSESEPELYNQIYQEVINIKRGMTEVHFASSGIEPENALPESGFCLRCQTEIPFAMDRPYCNSHYRTWARFKNADYEESHCHACGSEHDTSMAKPLCLACFRKYRSALEMAV